MVPLVVPDLSAVCLGMGWPAPVVMLMSSASAASAKVTSTSSVPFLQARVSPPQPPASVASPSTSAIDCTLKWRISVPIHGGDGRNGVGRRARAHDHPDDDHGRD